MSLTLELANRANAAVVRLGDRKRTAYSAAIWLLCKPTSIFAGLSTTARSINYFLRRCLSASNKTTPTATDTFSDVTLPRIGIVTTASQRSRTSR